MFCAIQADCSSAAAASKLTLTKVFASNTVKCPGSDCIGYYITPALVGGSNDQMLSCFIAFYANETINWGLAAAFGTVLMVIVLGLFGVYSRLFGIDQIRMN